MHGIPLLSPHNTVQHSNLHSWRRFSGRCYNSFQRLSWEVRWSKYARKQCMQIHIPIQQRYRFHKVWSWWCSTTSSTIRNICMTVSIRSQDCVFRRVLQIHRWNAESEINCLKSNTWTINRNNIKLYGVSKNISRKINEIILIRVLV